MSRTAEEQHAWASNTTLAEMAGFLRNAQRVVLLTHARPDGDAVGSTIAVARALQRIGREALPIYAGQWAHRFDPIVGATKTSRVSAGEQIPNALGGREPDAVLVLDTGAWQQLNDVRTWLAPRRVKTALIDHHLHGDGDVAELRHIDPASSAACQPAAELCRLLLGAAAPSELPREIAEPLYVGLATDTGWFRHSNVTSEVFALAGELLRAGVDHATVYGWIEQSDTAARPKLMCRALSSMSLHYGERLAVMSLSRADLAEFDGDLDEVGGFGDLPMCIGAVRASAMLTELDPNLTKVSLRSKRLPSGESVDVNRVASSLGGGGHRQAAGAKVKAPLEEARRLVVDAFREALP